MSKSVYTVEMIETMTAQAPLNAEKCAALATSLVTVLQAVPLLQKQKAQELTTTVKAAPARKKAAASKLDLVKAITKAVDADEGALDGLLKAPASALSALLSNV